MLVDGEESRWIVLDEVVHFAVVANIPVSSIHLLDPFSYNAILFNARTVIREIKYRGIVVCVTDLHPDRTESRQRGIALILGFDSDTKSCDSNLTFTVKDVCRAEDSTDGFYLKAFAALVVALDNGISDIAIGACVLIYRFDLNRKHSQQSYVILV